MGAQNSLKSCFFHNPCTGAPQTMCLNRFCVILGPQVLKTAPHGPANRPSFGTKIGPRAPNIPQRSLAGPKGALWSRLRRPKAQKNEPKVPKMTGWGAPKRLPGCSTLRAWDQKRSIPQRPLPGAKRCKEAHSAPKSVHGSQHHNKGPSLGPKGPTWRRLR